MYQVKYFDPRFIRLQDRGLPIDDIWGWTIEGKIQGGIGVCVMFKSKPSLYIEGEEAREFLKAVYAVSLHADDGEGE